MQSIAGRKQPISVPGVAPVPIVQPGFALVAREYAPELILLLQGQSFSSYTALRPQIPVPFVKPPLPVIAAQLESPAMQNLVPGAAIAYASQTPVPFFQPPPPQKAETEIRSWLLSQGSAVYASGPTPPAFAYPRPVQIAAQSEVVREVVQIIAGHNPVPALAPIAAVVSAQVELPALLAQGAAIYSASRTAAIVVTGTPLAAIVAQAEAFIFAGAAIIASGVIPVPTVKPGVASVAAQADAFSFLFGPVQPRATWNEIPNTTIIQPAGPITIVFPALAMLDNKDGTVTAKITATNPSANNVVYTSPADTTVRAAVWTNRGNRQGDGSLTFSLPAGMYWAKMLSTISSPLQQAIAPLVMFGATSGLTDVHEQCVLATISHLQGINFNGTVTSTSGVVTVNGVGVTDGLVPIDEFLTFPCIMVTAENVSENYAGMTNARDDEGFPVRVTIIDQSDMVTSSAMAARRPKYTKWREQIERAFSRQRLGGVPDIFDSFVEPGPIVDGKLPEQQYVVSGMTVRFMERIGRGLT
jgi:hypothetical protein